MTTEETAIPLPAASVGATLRRLRLEKNLTVEQIAQDTKIHIKFIRALEEEHWAEFPARVYLEGFLKRYADLLGTSGEELLKILRPALQNEVKPGFSSPAPREDRNGETTMTPSASRPLWFLAVSAGLVMGLALVYVKLDERRARVEYVAPVVPLAVPAPAPVAPPAPAVHDVRLSATSPVWVRVWLDGKVKFEGILPATVEKAWTAEDSLRVMAGNPSILTVLVDGKPVTVQPGGPAGEIRWKEPAPEAPAAPSAPAAAPAPPAQPS